MHTGLSLKFFNEISYCFYYINISYNRNKNVGLTVPIKAKKGWNKCPTLYQFAC